MKKITYCILFLASLFEAKAQTKIDSTFGTNGVVAIPNSTNKNLKWNIAKSLPDGSTLVGTIGTWSDGLTSSSKLILSKLTNNSTLDPSFGTNGQVIVYGNKIENRFKYLEIRDIVPLPNGNIFLVGDERDGAVARKQLVTRILNANGQAITASNQTPIATYFHALSVTGAKLAQNGNIVIAGYGINPSTNTQDIFTAMLSTNGAILPFGGQALLKWTNYSSKDICTDVVLDADDKIYVTGYTNQTGRDAYCVTAFEPNGNALTTFGNAGKVVVQVSQTGQDRAFKAIIHPNNTLFLVGASRMTDKVRDIVSVINLTKKGTLNKTFDYDGKAFVFIGSGNSRAYDVKISKDTALYIAGVVENKTVFNPMVIKMNTKGKLDEAYGTKGISTLTTSVISDLAIYYNVAIDFNSVGKLLVAGINSNSANGQHVTQMQSVNKYSAAFTAAVSGLCNGSVSVTAASQEGEHYWSLTPDDYRKYLGDQYSTFANPSFGVGISGSYTLSHDYFDPEGNYFSESQGVYLDQTPSAHTIGIDFYPGDVENFPYMNYDIDLYYNESTEVSGNYIYSWTKTFNVSVPGIYPISITVKTDAASQCPQILEDTVIVPITSPRCLSSDTATYGVNLVINGTFDDITCPPTSFGTSFKLKCGINEQVQEGEAAFVNDINQYYPKDTTNDWSYDYEESMDGIEGNFLLLSRKTETNLKDKYAWTQKVYVEAGKNYRFKTSFANISYAKLNDYTFPVLFLLVDSLPLSGDFHYSSNGNCFSGFYIATKTGWVTLRLVRENKYLFSKGVAAIDNIEFAEMLTTSPQMRTENLATESISIFPSPASDMVEVKHVFTNGIPENATIQIVDIFTGREVQKAVAQGNTTHLNVTNLENGLYIVRLFESNGKLMASSKLAISK